MQSLSRFNVRPAGNARLADNKEIDIRYYSIIYAAMIERCNGRNACSRDERRGSWYC
jgi:translation initiation factor IF-2